MKKIVTFLLAAGLLPATIWADSKTAPYASGLYQDSDWTVVDVNNDSKTWTDDKSSDHFKGSGYTTGKIYSYSSSNPGDDWLISPAIYLEAGKEYKAKYWVQTGNYIESLELKYAVEGNAQALSSGVLLTGFTEEKKYNNSERQVAVFTVETSGDYYFGLHAYSPKDKGWIYVTGFEVCENVFAPAGVSSLTCTPGEDRALSATLTWTLPTTDNDGAPLPEGASFDEIIIKRDGAPVRTNIDANATEWTDSETAGLTPGFHTYEVAVVVNGAQSAFTSVTSKYIGPVEAMALPYDAGVKTLTQDDFDLFWVVVKGRNSTTTNNWKLAISSYSGNNIQYSPGSGKVQDNWLISPQMKFTEAGVYKLSINMSYTNYTKTDFDILLGSGTTIGGYTDVIKNYTDIPSNDTDFEIFFTVETPGEYGIAFHPHASESSYYAYYLKNFKVEKWHSTPEHITDLTTTVNDDATVTLNWTNPSKTNTGADLTDLTKVELYCNDELAETFTDVTPGTAMSHTHTPATAGVHTYHVVAHSSEGAADGEPVKVTTAWVGDETQTLPYTTQFAATDATAPIWSGLNANDDGSQWVISTSGATLAVDKTQDAYRNGDYLLSPYFDFTPGYYSFRYTIKGAGKNAKLSVGTVSDKTDVAATFSSLGSITLPGQSWTSDYEIVAKIENEGKYAIALYSNDYVSSSDYNIVVTKVQFAYKPVLPDIASNVTVTPAANLSLSATISWTNPSTSNVEGITPELVKAEISRNGEVIGEVTSGLATGEEAFYVDETVPNAGEYTYSVTVYGPEGASTAKPTEVKSPWIGAGLNMPFDCSDGFRGAGWTIFNVNNDSNNYGPITWEAGYNSIYITSGNNTPDDWAITPRLNFNPGSRYKVTVTSYYSNDYGPVDWDLHFGTSVDPESQIIKIATIHTSNPSASKQTDVFYLETTSVGEVVLVAEFDDEEEGDTEEEETPAAISVPSGVGTIGMHANNKGAFNVSQFSIIEEKTSSEIEEIEAEGNIIVTAEAVIFGAEASSAAVVDLAGKTLASGSNVTSLPLTSLAKGVYVVTATIDDKTTTIKIVK
ncbi:MAG: T9SS type A sorting domain-containing protein [Bacteroides sp.]|nr:T9SS type A sorting domain-containing protein [Bacteroides sp.]MCM1379340.1 T9SS type A sorting domain-containing protein [Bacteroides sp.]MCM1445001.1 T9SS type A sorting domain-containing protein [Prevotella sp.]